MSEQGPGTLAGLLERMRCGDAEARSLAYDALSDQLPTLPPSQRDAIALEISRRVASEGKDYVAQESALSALIDALATNSLAVECVQPVADALRGASVQESLLAYALQALALTHVSAHRTLIASYTCHAVPAVRRAAVASLRELAGKSPTFAKVRVCASATPPGRVWPESRRQPAAGDLGAIVDENGGVFVVESVDENGASAWIADLWSDEFELL